MKDCSFVIAVILFLFQLYPDVDATAYDNQITHRYINEMAVKNKADIDSYIKTSIGMHDGIYTVIGTKRIWEWISDGGEKEDDPESRCPKHFHDPLSTNWDIAGLSIPPLGYFPSMIYWAQSSDNEYSWLLARDYYYQALLTGSEEQYAKTFRAMGQLMHLVSDAAVPSHVRNDAHLKLNLYDVVIYDDSDPYENWVRQKHSKIESMDFDDVIVNRAIFDMAVENKSASSPISALWDHDEYNLESNPPDDSNTAIGLAEYTSANFWTEDTFPWEFNTGNYPHPALEDINYDENVWLNPEEIDAEDGVMDKRIYFSKITDETGTPFLAAGYWHWQLYMWNKPEVDYAFLLDEKCYEQYAKKLIPRAIGYSTALLDYFFRGAIAIQPPDEGVFAVIDAGNTDQQFETIRAKLHNTTPDEEMLQGTLVAVARYKRRLDYLPDLSANEPPSADSVESNFAYSISTPIPIEALTNDPDAAENFAFDFSADPIPAGITDLYLQVVFNGTLGGEANTAVAVGMLDLAEPNHIAVWNLVDRFYILGELMKASDIRVDDQLMDYLESMCPHLLAYLYPFAMDVSLGFGSSLNAATIPEYPVDYPDLPPGRFGKLIVLSDHPNFVMRVRRVSASPQLNQTYTMTYSSVTNQINGDAFNSTPAPIFRGIGMHNFTGFLFSCPDMAGLTMDDWPLVDETSPVPADINYP